MGTTVDRETAIARVGISLYVCVLGVLYAKTALSPDQATFAYVGWLMSEGATLYVDVGEQNFPGAMWLHWLATSLFGREPWSWRAIEMLILCGGTFALGQLLPRTSRFNRLMLWLIYPLFYVTGGTWFSGQRDIVAGHLLVISGAFFAARLRGGHVLHTVAIGAALFLAVMLRPTFLLFGPLLWVIAVATRTGTGATWRLIWGSVGATVGVFIALCAGLLLVGYVTGGLSGFYEHSIAFNLGVYQETTFQWDFLRTYAHWWWWFFPVAMIGVAVWWKDGGARVGVGILVGVTVTTLVSYFVMGKGFQYHLGALHPVLGAFTAVGMASAAEALWRPPNLRRRVVAAAVSLLALAGMAKGFAREHDNTLLETLGIISTDEMRSRQLLGDQWLVKDLYAVAARIEAEVAEDETVLMWHRLPLISYLSGRKLPFIWSAPGVLEVARPPFEYAESWQAQAAHALNTAPPRMIVTEHDEQGELALAQPEEPPTRFVAWVQAALQNDYREIERIGNMRLWIRR